MEINEIGLSSSDTTNRFYATTTIPKEVDNEIGKEIQKIQQNVGDYEKINYSLAGKINHEYDLPHMPILESYIKGCIEEVEGQIGYGKKLMKFIGNHFCHSFVSEFEYSSYWINFMKKHEYNPPHIHNGVYSWTIWYKIPYTLKGEEMTELGQATKSHKVKNGDFVFSIVDPFLPHSVHHNFSLDNKFEKTLIIFPSNLEHSVLPFYSTDEYRITLAGNIRYKINKLNKSNSDWSLKP